MNKKFHVRHKNYYDSFAAIEPNFKLLIFRNITYKKRKTKFQFIFDKLELDTLLKTKYEIVYFSPSRLNCILEQDNE